MCEINSGSEKGKVALRAQRPSSDTVDLKMAEIDSRTFSRTSDHVDLIAAGPNAESAIIRTP